jgi:hypothetical protein
MILFAYRLQENFGTGRKGDEDEEKMRKTWNFCLHIYAYLPCATRAKRNCKRCKMSDIFTEHSQMS